MDVMLFAAAGARLSSSLTVAPELIVAALPRKEKAPKRRRRATKSPLREP
jgi:hypothetical protein